MNQLLHDIAYAWRNLLRQPATSLLIIVTLALGIGVNTAMFSMTWHVLLAPLPYADGDRLVKLEQHEPGNQLDDMPWSLLTLTDIREQSSAFSAVIQYFQEQWTLYSDRGPFLVDTGTVDGSFFATLGLTPALGRLFAPEDDRSGAAPVMLLGNRFWIEEFGGSPDVLGTTMEMNGFSYTVVGVLPEMPPYPGINDVWITAANDFVMSNERVMNERRQGVVSHVIGKLGDSVSLEKARLDLEILVGQLKSNYPDIYSEDSGYTISLKPLKEDIIGASARTVSLLMSLAALVVLIVSLNFANITLAGVMRRSQELAVREAVGADPGRIRRQLLTECIVISVIGGLAGLVLAAIWLRFLAEFAAIYTPLATEISLDGRVLWFCLVLAVATGLISAFVASVQTRDINRSLKEGGDKATSSIGAKSLRDTLLAAQCALAFVMLTSTALMVSSLYGLTNQPTGYDTESVVMLSTTMRGMDISTMWPERDMMLQVLAEARVLPGVTASGISGTPLLQGGGFPAMPMVLERRGVDGGDLAIRERFTIVSQDFFSVMRIPLLAGRIFAGSDDENAPEVVVVNDKFATRYFAGGDAVGQRISLNQGNNWAAIIGIVGDIRARGIDTPDAAMVYTHYGASPTQRINLYVKTTTDLRQTANAVAAIIQRLDPLQPIDAITPLDEVRDQWLAPTKLRTSLIAVFGVLALVVTLSGVIGVVSYNISQRVREIGVHMAIGAHPTGIMRLFIFQGLKIFLRGLLLGLALMLVAAPSIEPLLYETSAMNPLIYLASALVLSLTVLLALYLPARRAARMEPVSALRSE
ncbi:MAG TPA: ABC transporter permease [Hyphomicrobiales bacterium]|nr:ABC transporter permease [Hyphomicrobiales bacterium]